MLESEDLSFWKMHGSGNDFIIIDNRRGFFHEKDRSQLVARLCRRGSGIGADGLILIENDPEFDFLWHFYNADGSEAEMCGNGGRCAARFAYLKRIADAVKWFFGPWPVRYGLEVDRDSELSSR